MLDRFAPVSRALVPCPFRDACVRHDELARHPDALSFGHAHTGAS